MNKSFSIAAAALCLCAAYATAAVPSGLSGKIPALNEKIAAWNKARTPRKSAQGFSSFRTDSSFEGMRKNPSVAGAFTGLDDLSTLEMPDGSFWYYTSRQEFDYIEYEFFTERIMKSFVFDIYDSNLKFIGSIADDVLYQGEEYKIAVLELSSVVTKKFFNSDDRYEFMLSFSYNTTTEGLNTYYTRVYSLNGTKDDNGHDKVIYEIPDLLLVDSVNAVTDAWSENFYLTFLGEEDDPSQEELIDYLESYKMVLHTYKKCGYGGEPQLVAENKIAYCHLPGDQADTPCMVSWTEGARAYFALSQYEKRYFEDPTGISGNDDIVPDNNLVTDIYSIGTSEKEWSFEKRLTIPVVHVGGDGILATFYSIGNLDYENDFIHDGDSWRFVMTKQLYSVQDEETTNSYYLIDETGNVTDTIFEDADASFRLSDVRGLPSQFMFIEDNEGEYILHFVDPTTAEEIFSIPADMEEGSLTTNCDRVKYGDSALYAFKARVPSADDYDNDIEEIFWFDSTGNLVRKDKVNLGADVAYATVYLSQEALTPYFYNTDSKMEYMFLVKRYLPYSEAGTREELLIVNTDNEKLLEITPEDGNVLRSIIVVANKPHAMIEVIYTDYEEYSAEFYELPLSSLTAGGSGTAKDPYLIESIADLHEIGSSLSSHYRLACDIDASGYEFEPIEGDFKGSLDGAGHTISNLDLVASSYYSGIFSAMTSKSSVKDINLKNVTIDIREGAYSAATIAGRVLDASISGIHVNGITVNGNGRDAMFGGIASDLLVGSTIESCSLADAYIDVPSSVGGIVADMRTGAKVSACAFSGTIFGGTEVGGIAGSTNTGDETIEDCHVNAVISGRNTIGGIAGAVGRTFVKRCYFEGEITARGGHTASWGDAGPCTGGIVGLMRPNFEDGDDGYRISSCVVNLSKFTAYTPEAAERYPNEQDTFHRIVGKSRANYEPEIADYDENGNPIYIIVDDPETGIINNYAIVGELSGEEALSNHKSVDGGEVAASALGLNFWTDLGYKFGDDSTSPWKLEDNTTVILYFEPSPSGVEAPSVESNALRFAGNELIAHGENIEVYDLNGLKVLEGHDRLTVATLPKGMYVAVATSSRKVIKFTR